MEYRVLQPPEPAGPYRPDGTSVEELEPDPTHGSRRQLLTGGLALALGIGGTLAARAALGGGGTSAPGFVADMLSVLAEQLLRCAPAYRSLAKEHPRDARLSAGFERLLSVAIEARHDTAAEHAVRVLASLERGDALRSALPELERLGLTRAAAALRAALGRG